MSRRTLLGVPGWMALGFILVVLFIPANLEVRPQEAPPKTKLQRLFEQHECWTDDGAEHPIPAGALVTKPGGEPRVYPADVGFRIWLEGRPGTLHAFCKVGPRGNLDTSPRGDVG